MIFPVRTLALAIVTSCISNPLPAAIFAVSSGSASALYRIDLESSTVAIVAPTRVDHLTGLAYHAEMGVLFAHQA